MLASRPKNRHPSDVRLALSRWGVIVSGMNPNDECPVCRVEVPDPQWSTVSGIGGPNNSMVMQPARQYAVCSNEHRLERVEGCTWHLSEDNEL